LVAIATIGQITIGTIAYFFKKENKEIVRNSPGLCDDPSLCVLYKDIEEQRQCTPLEKRKRKDKATVKSFLAGQGIDPTCITDTQRLGLYHPPRYLVVKCRSKEDADAIIHHRGVSKHISPFLCPEDLAKQDILNKQKKLLVKSGVNPRAIQLKGDWLLLNN
jgi:hypothetical protein